MTTEAELDEPELVDLENQTSHGQPVVLPCATVLSLVAEVRRARRLESESSPEAKRIKSQLAYLHDLGVRVVTPDGNAFALLDGSIDHIACETGWEEST